VLFFSSEGGNYQSINSYKMKKIIFSLIVVLLGFSASYSATFYYMGAGGNFSTSAGDWHSPAIGTPVGGLPGAGDDIIVWEPGLIIDANQTFNSVIIDGAGSMEIATGVSVIVTTNMNVDGVFISSGVSLVVNGSFTVNISADTQFLNGTLDVIGTFLVNDGSTVNITSTTLPHSTPTGCLACVTGPGAPAAVPVPMWAIFVAFGLIGMFVIYRYKRKTVVA